METHRQRHRYIHSFSEYPDVSFSTQRVNEKIILVLRSHPITQVGWVINGIIMFTLLFLTDVVLPNFFAINQIIFFNLIMIAFIISYIWFNFLHWFFNVGIVTNERVLDLDYSSVTYKESTEAKLNKIEDITAKQVGYLGSFFNYGDVFVQTAGTEANIEFMSVPEPSTIVKIIDGLVHR